MSNAPVCLANPPSVTVTPIQRLVPNVPVATDLNSALAAINALRQLVYMLLNSIPANGQPGPPGAAGQSPQKTQSKFTQSNIVYNTVRVTNPQDDTQYVDIQQVQSLTLINPVTKETWVWQRASE